MAGLTNLRVLHLDNTRVSDLAPLSGLTNMESLYLSNTIVSDLAPLAGMTRMRGLRLDDTPVRSLDHLADMTDLEQLRLDRTPVSDLAPLSGMSSLERLTLANATVADLGPVANLHSLTHLDASNTKPLRRSACYRNDPPPESFRFANTVSKLPPLGALRHLRVLHLDYNRISNLRALEGLTNLRTVTASGNRLSDLAGLEGLMHLRILELADNTISDLAPLAGLSGLTRLWLDGNAISDLAPLEGIDELVHLHLDDNAVSDVAALVGLTELALLDLGHNAISDIEPLGSLPKLRTLYLERNEITNLVPFREFRRANNLWVPRMDLRGNPLDDDSMAIAAIAWKWFQVPGDDHGDLPRAATPLIIGEVRDGSIDPKDEVDYFRVEVREPVTLDITTLTTESNNETWEPTIFVDSRGTLRTDSGRVLAHGRHISHRLQPGTHYIEISSECWDDFERYDTAVSIRPRTRYTVEIREVAEVHVPDANLRGRLRDEIERHGGRSVDAITTSHMLRLHTVRASDSHVVDLTGLESARRAWRFWIFPATRSRTSRR